MVDVTTIEVHVSGLEGEAEGIAISNHPVKGRILSVHVNAAHILSLTLSETQEPFQTILKLRGWGRFDSDGWFYPAARRCDLNGNAIDDYQAFVVSDVLTVQVTNAYPGTVIVTIVSD